RRDIGRVLKDTAVFEVGMVTHPDRKDAIAPIPPLAQYPGEKTIAEIERALPHQPLAVAGALTGYRRLPSPGAPGQQATWRDAITLAAQIGEVLGLELTVSAAEHAPWHPGRCAALSLTTGEIVGYA